MGLKRKKENVEEETLKKLQENGGAANIANPVTQVLNPAVDEVTPSSSTASKDIVYNVYRAEKIGELPVRMPEKPTIENIAERIFYEELMLAARDRYEELTGEDIQLNLSGSDFDKEEE